MTTQTEETESNHRLIPGEGPNTRIALMYRDAANYKKIEHIVLAGALTQGDLEKMASSLDDGQFLLPEKVGLPALNPKPVEHDEDLDHPWHTIVRVVLTDAPATHSLTTAAMLEAWPADRSGWTS